MGEIVRHIPPILDVLTQREAELATHLENLRDRITQLGEELTQTEAESARLNITRQTLTSLTDPTPTPDDTGPDYQTLLGAFQGNTQLRVRDLCQLLGLDTNTNTLKRIRGRLKRLTARRILAEPERGLFTLAQTDSE